MKIIKKLSEFIEDELDGAEEYIEDALLYKEEYPMIAKTLFDISIEEMKHVDMLHNDVVDIIEKYKREHGDPPEAMAAIYEHIHKKNIKKAAKIKMYQNQYKGV